MYNHRRNIGLAAGWVLCFLPLALIEAGVLRHTGGQFIYPVDDTFIHMEVARNLAHYGNWGINSHEFGSASSSVLYTLLLGFLTRIFSPSVYLPFIVNCLAGGVLVAVVNQWLSRQPLKLSAHLFILALVIVLTPLPVLIMSGMEHTLQSLFSFLFLFGVAEWFGKPDGEKKTMPWSLALFGMLVTATRYEGLFLVGMACLGLAARRKWATAFFIGGAAMLPVLAFGLYSLSKGSYFLPNSVLVKSEEVPLFGAGLGHLLETVLVEKLTLMKPGITALATQRLVLLLPLTYLLFRRFLSGSYTFVLLSLTGCTLLHLALASTGKFYRYEAYLVLCATLIIATCFIRFTPALLTSRQVLAWSMGGLLLFFLGLPLLLRSTAAFSKAGRACINIYEQQFQMGRFLEKYYPHSTIAANDIGAVSYFTQGYMVDLWGLGTFDIARSRRQHVWGPAFLDSFSRAKNTRIALIYDSWFGNQMPRYWTRVATWKIANNVVCGDDLVSFYAVDPAEAAQLRAHLQAYEAVLPKTVAVAYY